MAYRKDPGLDFLKEVPSSDLGPLVDILTKTKDGTPRLTEELTTNSRYKEAYPEHQQYWDLVAAEIQCFGANTIATMLRGGKGVPYREVLKDVCDKLKVDYNKASNTEVIELNLLIKVLADSMAEMNEDDLKKVSDELGLDPTEYTAEAVTVALQVAIKMGGFAPYKVALIVANAVAKAMIGRGLSVGANAALTRTMGVFVGPIGWALSAIWLLVDIAAPAYRITVPAVIMVAYLRLEMTKRAKKKAKKKAMKKAMKKAERKIKEAGGTAFPESS